MMISLIQFALHHMLFERLTNRAAVENAESDDCKLLCVAFEAVRYVLLFKRKEQSLFARAEIERISHFFQCLSGFSVLFLKFSALICHQSYLGFRKRLRRVRVPGYLRFLAAERNLRLIINKSYEVCTF